MFAAAGRRTVVTFALSLFAAALLGGCAAIEDDTVRYQKVLVVGMAENYTNRAQFESAVAAGLRERGAEATPYYRAVGGNTPIERERVRELAVEGGFDAILVTRILSADSDVEVKSGSTAVKSTRRDGRPLDFFRYDYEELNEPLNVALESQVTVAVGIYDTSTVTLVWDAVFDSPKSTDMRDLVGKTAAGVLSRVNRSRRIVSK